MTQPIQIILIEDNLEFRKVVSLALDEESDIELADQFGTAEIALRRLQDRSNPQPDLILLDLRLPGMSGHDALPYIRDYSPQTKVIVLTQSDKEADVLLAISQGASGYLLKSASVQEIVGGIRSVMSGGASLDPAVAKFMVKSLRQRLLKPTLGIELTQREMEILTLLGEGLVKKQIADKLSIGYSTVDTHVGHIYEKLQVRNAPSAIGKAYRLGLFPND